MHDIVYWTDRITSTIYVGSLMTNQYGILINNKSFINKPSGIVVDPKNEGGYVFQYLVILYQRFVLTESSPIKCQCCPHIETCQLICCENQLLVSI